jgi:autotransporter-associated beta strand protein
MAGPVAFGGGGGGGEGGTDAGGFGGGNGGAGTGANGGGGGAGMGGAVFVMQGASLTIVGKTLFIGDSAQGGTAGGGGTDGQAFGGGMFLEGNGTIRFSPRLGQTEHVFNAIADEAGVGGASGSYTLIKAGLGTLVLSADNSYSGGTILKAGTLEVSAQFAAGGGPAAISTITFAGSATLKIDNGALSDPFDHTFAFGINSLGKHDALDLTGLHFHHGATARYDTATDDLFVHSGSLTYELGLQSPHGTHFAVANDGHGGTKVTLDPPGAAAHASALFAGHDLGPCGWAGDHTASGAHMSDFLFTA